jgi:fatty acid desaturase
VSAAQTKQAAAAPEVDANGSAPKPGQYVSNDIPIALKSTLVDSDGVPYREFRRGLTPRWWRVALDLTLAYAVLIATVAVLVVWDPGMPIAIAATIGGALVIGYTVHFINCFFHEASHYNVIPGRRRNDLVVNALMGWLFASSVALYRPIHFQHHRALGSTMDPENTYFDPLRVRFLAEALLGVKLLRSMRENREAEAALEDSGRRSGAAAEGSRLLWTGIAGAVNLAIVAGLIALGSLPAAIAWVGGMLMVFPFMASLRTVLEHRAEDADPRVDYSKVDQGPVNRLFGSGPLASTMGSAGFNRHAIHHWEPQVSYTRLKDIEAYLLRTDVAPLIRERQTTYTGTFLRLLEL